MDAILRTRGGIGLTRQHLNNFGALKQTEWWDQQSWVTKQDLTTALITTPNGELYPAQSDAFVRILELGAVIVGLSSVRRLTSKKADVNQIRVQDRVLRRGQEGVALAAADRATPTHEVTEFNTVLLRGEIVWTREFIEDNIEGDRYVATLMDVIGSAVARDLDELFVNGDVTDPDPYLASMNGMIAQATSHTYNAGGGTLDSADFGGLLRTLPPQFRRKQDLRWFGSPNSEENYRDTLIERVGGLSDRQLVESPPIVVRGVQWVTVPVWPDDLGGGNETAVILASPSNLGVGVWRGITMQTVTDVRADTAAMVVSLRVDFKYLYEPAVAKAQNIAAS